MKFSLVIPVAPERNAEILSSVNELSFPKKDYEIIIEKGKNPSLNRNEGAKKSNGEIIVFLDDDAVLDKNYLTALLKFFDDNKNIDIVGGPQLTPDDDKGFAKYSGYVLCSKFGAWKISNRYCGTRTIIDADETCLTSANMACKNYVFKKVCFDTTLFPGEDPKFITDAKKQGYKVAYSPDLKIYHRRRTSFKSFIKQIFNYGKVRPLKETFIDTLKMPFFLIPSIFIIYLALLVIFLALNILVFNLSRNIILLFSFPLILYILALIIFSLYDSYKNKDYKAIFVLPFIYPMIHFSYGSGMIFGYLKKITS